MTADVERPVICSKCGATSGNDWKQCGGSCPLPDSPHHKATADIELPPLPGDIKDRIHVYVDNSFARPKLIALMQDHALACVAHATAAKDAEIEALRAEVARLTQELQKAPLRRLQETSARAERLADALRDLLEGTGPACNARIRARAALHPTAAQEGE